VRRGLKGPGVKRVTEVLKVQVVQQVLKVLVDK
jgi:hypothetical protein